LLPTAFRNTAPRAVDSHCRSRNLSHRRQLNPPTPTQHSLLVVCIMIALFWYARPYGLVGMYRIFRGAFCLQFRLEDRGCLFILNLGTYLSHRWCHISKDTNICLLCANICTNKYYKFILKLHKTKYIKCTRRQDQLTPINIENKKLEQVKSLKYLWSIINTDNTMEEEIKERIALGNKVYFANKKMFQSRLI
jgi:hypothetical protein